MLAHEFLLKTAPVQKARKWIRDGLRTAGDSVHDHVDRRFTKLPEHGKLAHLKGSDFQEHNNQQFQVIPCNARHKPDFDQALCTST
jgi:hypothetical protein